MLQYVEFEKLAPRIPLTDPDLRNGLKNRKLQSLTELVGQNVVLWGNITGNPSDNDNLLALLQNFEPSLGFIPLDPANNLSEITNQVEAIENLGLDAGGTNDVFLRKNGGTMDGGPIILDLEDPLRFQSNENMTTAIKGQMIFDGTDLYFTPDTTRRIIAYKDEAVSPQTANYTITSTDEVVLGDATSGDITITLPLAADVTGRAFTIKKVDSSANIVTVDANGAETIDGTTTFDLAFQYDYVKLLSDGTEWFIISNN